MNLHKSESFTLDIFSGNMLLFHIVGSGRQKLLPPCLLRLSSCCWSWGSWCRWRSFPHLRPSALVTAARPTRCTTPQSPFAVWKSRGAHTVIWQALLTQSYDNDMYWGQLVPLPTSTSLRSLIQDAFVPSEWKLYHKKQWIYCIHMRRIFVFVAAQSSWLDAFVEITP